MATLLLTLLFFQNTSYEEAYRAALSGERPLVLVITADFCGPCRRLKKELSHTNIKYVLCDHADGVASSFMQRENSVPQVHIWFYRRGAWNYRHRIGYVPIAQIKEMMSFP